MPSIWYPVNAKTNGCGAFCFIATNPQLDIVGKAPFRRRTNVPPFVLAAVADSAGGRFAMPTMTCQECGKRFHIKPSAVKRGRGKYCSVECRNSGWTKPANHCIDCGIEIGRRAIRCRSCAQADRWENGNLGLEEVRKKRSRAARNRSDEYKQRRADQSRALWEDAEYRSKQLHFKRSKEWKDKLSRLSKSWWRDHNYRAGQMEHLRSKEFRMLMQKRHSGHNSHLWRGGITDNPYDSNFTNSLREQIRERDGHRCKLCGAPETTQAHDVHHIDYDKANSVPANLITLCVSCHRRTNHNRRKWPNKLRGLLK